MVKSYVVGLNLPRFFWEAGIMIMAKIKAEFTRLRDISEERAVAELEAMLTGLLFSQSGDGALELSGTCKRLLHAALIREKSISSTVRKAAGLGSYILLHQDPEDCDKEAEYRLENEARRQKLPDGKLLLNILLKHFENQEATPV